MRHLIIGVLLCASCSQGYQGSTLLSPPAPGSPREALYKAVHKDEIGSLAQMPGGFCGPTSLHMNLAYEGVTVDPSVIYNLGWNYGFHYAEMGQTVIAWPTTYPKEQMEHAATTLGFTLEPFTAPSLAAAVTALKAQLDKGQPVIVHWAPHLVFAYGYDGDEILFHDPQDKTIAGTPAGDGNVIVGIGKGAYQKEDPKNWIGGIRAWERMGHPFYVVKKKAAVGAAATAIDWKTIWKRNGDRTLGTPNEGGNVPLAAAGAGPSGSPQGPTGAPGKPEAPTSVPPAVPTGAPSGPGSTNGGVCNCGPNGVCNCGQGGPGVREAPAAPAGKELFGVIAIKAFADRFEELYPTQPEMYGEWGHLGFTSRDNATTFLTAKATELRGAGKTEEARLLGEAAGIFKQSADLLKQGREVAHSAASVTDKARQMKDLLLKIAELETTAGQRLLDAAK